MRRTGEMLAIGATLAMVAAGCSDNNDKVDPSTERTLQGITTDDGDVSFQHELANGVVVETRYTTDYEVDQWKITEPKTLNFSLSIVTDETAGENPEGSAQPIVLVEHVHADVALEATRQGLDGIAQDSMDDSIHGGDQPGFYVSTDAPYSEIFSIEGFSESLISGWGFATGGTGASEITQERLTENNLSEAGVVGNEFSFIYDVVVQDPVTGLYSKAGMINDQFFVATRAYQIEQAAATATTLG